MGKPELPTIPIIPMGCQKINIKIVKNVSDMKLFMCKNIGFFAFWTISAIYPPLF